MWQGESLLSSGYKHWPKDLPLLIVHGTGDKVTDCDASAEFVQKVKAEGAKSAEFKPFEGEQEVARFGETGAE